MIYLNIKLISLFFDENWSEAISYCLRQGLQTTAREAISSGPGRHFVNIEKIIYLRKMYWFGRI